jgi:signal transduction histidine kinase/CheY-like chemotaxis protein
VSEIPFKRVSLTVRYVTALAIIGGLAIAGEVFRERVLDSQRSNTRIVNIAGRQRMLSQRLVKEVALAFHAADSATARGLLTARDSTLEAWAAGRRILLDGDAEQDYIALADGPLRSRLLAIAPLVDSMRTAAGELDLATLRAIEGRYLSEMDSITFGLTNQFEEQSAALIAADRGRVAVVLLVILLLGALVMRPAAHAISRSTRAMRAQNAALDAALVEARSAARLKDEFLATTSHELRTPLNAVIGLSGLMRTTTLDARQRQFVDTINASGENLLQLINDILDLSKMDAGKLELEQMDFELREILEVAVESLALRAESKGVELGIVVERDVADVVRGDAGRLGQVILNLLGNALKFTEHGSVMIRVQRATPHDERHLRVEVQDTGIGISPEAQGRLFQAFSQADASTTRKYGGTGLGLSISRRLIELMGGTIGVQSELGEGSTFWFEVPLREPEGTRLTDEIDVNAFVGVRVLVVDDLPANRLVLSTLLDSWGMIPVEADSAATAVVRAREAVAEGRPFALGILDWQMPEVDGYDLARTLRADPANTGMKLVLLSSFSRGLDESREDAASIDYSLSKPVRHRPLWRAVQTVLGDGAGDDPSEDPHAVPQFPAARVLVADDNPVNILVARAMLAQMGINVDTAANGIEAIEAVDRVSGWYDLILMDVQMPEMDGRDAARALREKYKTSAKYIPIVAVTAAAMPEDRALCLAAGMNDYVTKPIPFETLVATVKKWVPR